MALVTQIYPVARIASAPIWYSSVNSSASLLVDSEL